MSKMTIFLASFLLIVGCTNENQLKDTATEFLTSYLSTDYDKAAQMCTSSVSEKLLKATSDFKNLDNSITAKIKEKAAALNVQINSVEKISHSDTMQVNYSLIGQTEPIESSLCLVKEENNWKVCKLNK